MARSETNPKAPEAEATGWSAQNLPPQKETRAVRFSVIAVAAGLVAIILATAMSGPIRTAGSKMEPKRFQASAQTGKDMIQTGAPATSFMVASVQAHR